MSGEARGDRYACQINKLILIALWNEQLPLIIDEEQVATRPNLKHEPFVEQAFSPVRGEMATSPLKIFAAKSLMHFAPAFF